MGFWLFGKKRDAIEDIHSKLNNSFSNIKKDFTKVGTWVTHLDDHRKRHDERLSRIEKKVAIFEELIQKLQEREESKQVFKQEQTGRLNSQVFKQPFKRVFKQGEIDDDTEIGSMLSSLTVMERAAVWVLLNTELKLSYEDMAVTLGKNKNTMRVQMNNIKRKCEGLISESMDLEGRKRLYIEDNIKEKVLKTVKIKQNKAKK